MALTLAFDVYGTLIDTHGVVEALRPRLGSRALAFARAWRDKQLEYAFRRTVMGCYADFSVCVDQALTYTAQAFGVTLGAGDIGAFAGEQDRRRLAVSPAGSGRSGPDDESHLVL